MKSSIWFFCIAALIAVNAAGQPFPGERQGPSVPQMKRSVDAILGYLDVDGGGRLSKDEILDPREKLFRDWDLDGDDLLSLEEYEILLGAMANIRFELRFELADTDKDGSYSWSEFRFYQGAAGIFAETVLARLILPSMIGPGTAGEPEKDLFRELDVNSDKTLSRLEVSKARQLLATEAYKKLDEDEDGFLQLAEFQKSAEMLFTQLDKDEDKLLSAVELAQSVPALSSASSAPRRGRSRRRR